jgi:hypothetical protein
MKERRGDGEDRGGNSNRRHISLGIKKKGNKRFHGHNNETMGM